MPTERASQERQEIAQAAIALTAKVEDLDKHLTVSQIQIDRIQRVSRIQFIILLIGAVLLAGGVFLSVNAANVSRRSSDAAAHTTQLANCISDWANAYTKRAGILTNLSSNRSDALDLLVRQLVTGGLTPAQQQAAASAYIDASNAYKKAVVDNPIPPSPTFDCK